eukprot:7636109-Lingulodinium_polyedra.AAC.1
MPPPLMPPPLTPPPPAPPPLRTRTVSHAIAYGFACEAVCTRLRNRTRSQCERVQFRTRTRT